MTFISSHPSSCLTRRSRFQSVQIGAVCGGNVGNNGGNRAVWGRFHVGGVKMEDGGSWDLCAAPGEPMINNPPGLMISSHIYSHHARRASGAGSFLSNFQSVIFNQSFSLTAAVIPAFAALFAAAAAALHLIVWRLFLEASFHMTLQQEEHRGAAGRPPGQQSTTEGSGRSLALTGN